jgi:phosphate starvation-inducible PhoH-like protein
MKQQKPSKHKNVILTEEDMYIDELKFKKSQRARKQPLKPLNKKQERYIKAIENNPVVVAVGSAGTSKTYIPSIMAADLFQEKKIENIVIFRPMEGPGRALGTLPGDKNDKLRDWLTPVISTLKDRLGSGQFEYHVNKGNIEFCSLNQIKGRSFEDTFMLADEAEDMDIETIQSLVTRIGENTTLVMNGDIKQKHIKQKSGLGYILKLIKKYNLPIPIIEFTLDECVRSKVTKMFLECFEQEEEENFNKD